MSGRTAKQEQERISPNHVPTIFHFSVILSYWGAHSYYPRARGPITRKGNFSNFQYGPDRWVSAVHGAFKLDDLQSFKPILSPKFFNFFTFILGSPFLLPQRANYEKREFFQLIIWTRQMGFSAWGIQTGRFAVPKANVVSQIFQSFHFHTGESILITPEGQ